jgi:AraC-like DNA-binding protein
MPFSSLSSLERETPRRILLIAEGERASLALGGLAQSLRMAEKQLGPKRLRVELAPFGDAVTGAAAEDGRSWHIALPVADEDCAESQPDRMGRLTCCGGAASTDLVLALRHALYGVQLQAGIREALCVKRVRGTADRQRVAPQARFGALQPKLVETVMLVEAKLEEPLTIDDIADLAGLLHRQLERLFKQYLVSVPSRYYLELRLQRAPTAARITSFDHAGRLDVRVFVRIAFFHRLRRTIRHDAARGAAAQAASRAASVARPGGAAAPCDFLKTAVAVSKNPVAPLSIMSS